VHAALADPARLQITDTLLAGDASPSELAAMLAMPSNLLAHHLHVLEQAGIITRRRSEGDRRRTYLQLIPGALDSLAAPTARAALRVLFYEHESFTSKRPATQRSLRSYIDRLAQAEGEAARCLEEFAAAQVKDAVHACPFASFAARLIATRIRG
jgi:DNA-binding MarR family transcriptional regulator